jgi:surface antigen
MTSGKMISLTLAGLLLAACSEGPLTKQNVGGVIGGVGGAILGSQFGSGVGKIAATAVGGVLGGIAGSQIGKSLDEADKAKAKDAHKRAEGAPVGEPQTWSNPDSGHSGTVTPVSEAKAEDGRVCRDFETTVSGADGKTETATGTACRQPDGSWAAVR